MLRCLDKCVLTTRPGPFSGFRLVLKFIIELPKFTPNFRQQYFFVLQMRFTSLQPHKLASDASIQTTHTFSLPHQTSELKE